MARWIEVPAHRILEVERIEIRTGKYRFVNEKGAPTTEGETIYRVIQADNEKVFKIADLQPLDAWARDCFYLQEI